MTARQMEDAVVAKLEAELADEVRVGRVNRSIQTHTPKGREEVLVVYGGSRFGTPAPAQARRVSFDIYVGSQSLRPETGHVGALDLVDQVRDALSGFRIDGIGSEDAVLWCESESLVYYDDKTATHWYAMRWATETTYVG